MKSLRRGILDLFNRVDPEGLLDSTGVADEYLPEVDRLINVMRLNPPHNADAVIFQLHSIFQEHFRKGFPVGIFSPNDDRLDYNLVTPVPERCRHNRCQLPGFHSLATSRERCLGRMIWKTLQASNRSILGQDSRENEPPKPDRPGPTDGRSSNDAHD
jgi:hypothetical protein